MLAGVAVIAVLTCTHDSTGPVVVSAMKVDAGPDLRAYPGASMALSFAVSDTAAASSGPWAVSVTWGDGVSDHLSTDSLGHLVTASHAFSTPGTYTVRLMAMNAGGATASDTLTAFVDAPGTPEVLIGAGDIAACDTTMQPLHVAATAQILDTVPGTVFTLGDNAYPNGALVDYQTCYDPYWGRHKKRTRPTPGNHEYYQPHAAGYFAYFGVAAGDPTKGWYSYDLGAWHVVVLNSSFIESQALAQQIPVSAQVAWLRADLAAHPSTCTLAMWHHPRFSSGTTHGSNAAFQPFWQVLYDAGADVVLAGHEHNYERFAPQTPTGGADAQRGIREFVAGTGGAGYNPLGPPIANSEVQSIVRGLLKLTLMPASYHWQFIARSGQTFSDSGTAACH